MLIFSIWSNFLFFFVFNEFSFGQKCVTALEQTWHPDHFFCNQCGCQFGEDGFHEKDGKPYCKADYLGMFALKCKGCDMAISEGYISALNAQWHAQCFVCRVSLSSPSRRLLGGAGCRSIKTFPFHHHRLPSVSFLFYFIFNFNLFKKIFENLQLGPAEFTAIATT